MPHLLCAALAALALTPTPPPPHGTVIEAAYPVPGSYLVTLKDGSPADLTARHGGHVDHVYTSAVKGYAARMSAAQAAELAADPRVVLVEQDSVVTASDTQPNPPSWGLDRVDQRDLPLDHSYSYPSAGAGVTVYTLDTGIRPTHVQFGGRASIGADEVGDGRDGQDCAGHGTHVAGTVGGADYGIAKQVKLVAVRVLDCSGHGTASQIIAGVDWVTAHAAKPAVVNMSLNGGASKTEDTAIRKSIASGVTYVVSSGNGNTDACRNSPGRIGEAIVVDNADSRDRRASDSNYGSCTDLFAPGVAITSAWNSGDTATRTIGGTSMAAPHVTGAAAIYLAAHPGASPAAVQDALVTSATPGKIANPGSGTPNRLLYIDPATTTGG